MKKSKILVIGALAGLTIASLSAVIAINAKNSVEAKGYTAQSIASVTTIDLNDTSASSIRSYYSSLNNLSTSERQGTNLLKNLKPILKNNQKYYAYDGASLWAMYEITDRDWSKSPASSISGYNASTKKISNYSYGSSYSNPGMNPYIHELYINRNVDNQCKAWTKTGSEASHGGNKEWYIDQEHIWPKSQGFNESGAGGARGDPMHLWPGDSYVNSALHSNNFYGYVNTSSSYTDGKSKYSEVSGNYLGKSLNISGTDSVFEPQDSDKGDIARAIFYMVARYNYYSGSDSDGIDTNNPNLELVQSSTSLSSYTSSKTNKGQMGILTDLLQWNRIDPPDEFEIHRNNLLYTNYTNNRNPFIDFPEWAEFIWGDVTYSGRKLSSYSSTPTGYATPSTDSINTWNSGTVTPTLYLNKDTLSLTVDGTETLTATALNGSGSVTWSSSDESIATVSSSGLVTAKAAGTATITASYSGITATCTVTVNTSGSGGQTGDSVTITTTIADYADANNWSNGTQYTSVTMDDVVTASVTNGSSNTGKYYTDGENWRFYQSETGTITIAVPSGYLIDSVTINYTPYKTGALFDSSDNVVSSGTAVAVNGTSVSFYTANSTSGATSGQARITSISVTYHATSSGSSTVTGVTLNPSSLSLDLAGTRTATIAATVTGTNSPSQNVLWESSDESIVTVEDGDVTAKAVGTATITVTSVADSTKSATCSVTVTNSASSEQTVVIKYSDTFVDALPTASSGVSTTAVEYTDSTSNFVFKAANIYKGASAQYIMFYHTSSNNGFLYNTSSLGTISNVKIYYSSSTGTSGRVGVYFGLSEINTYQSASNTAVPTASGSETFTNLVPNNGFFQIAISTGNVQISQIDVTYNTSGSSKTLSSIAVSDPQVSFTIGQEFNFGGTVTATYSDYSTADVTLNATFSGYNMDVVGVYTVTASYGGKTATYTISVNDVNTKTSPYLNGIPYKMYFDNTSTSKTWFFVGTASTYYGKCSETYSEGIDVYFEQNGDGQNIYMMDGSTKKYFYVTTGDHTNFKFDATSVPESKWTYLTDYSCMAYSISGVYYTLGTYDSNKTFSAYSLTKYPDNYKVQFTLTGEGYSQLFMENITCDASGNTSPTFNVGYTWAELGTIYSSMKDGAKSELQSAEANKNGTTYLAKAMYRYDYIVGKYGTATYTDFIGRNPASIGRAPLTIFSEVNPTSMTAIIVLLTLVGVTSIGVIITLKKRKEN